MWNVVADRYGFACNSSSTHSIIILNPDQYGKESSRSSEGEYGWDNFVLNDPESKSKYAAAAILEFLSYRNFEFKDDPDSEVYRVVEEITGIKPYHEFQGEEGREYVDAWYIDHESQPSFPVTRGGEVGEIDVEFAKAWFKWMTNSESVMILGGNDNDEGHPLNPSYIDQRWKGLFNENHGQKFWARNDGDHWVMFYPDNGQRVRIRLSDDTTIPIKARAPELVDIKITDNCPFKCPYCYQGSLPNGRTPSIEDIQTIAQMCSDFDVFEVAIGGGEPTLYVEFLAVLYTFREHDIVPNFTTRNLAWLNGPDTDEILSLAGGVAFSVESLAQAEAVAKAVEPHKGKAQFSFQIVEGIPSLSDLRAIWRLSAQTQIQVTMLGYKTTGFGKGQKRHNYDWINLILEGHISYHDRPYMLATDTVVVARESERLSVHVDERFLTGSEGAFSMYMDAVTMTASPSSFEPDNSRDVRITTSEEVLKAFQSW